MIKYNDGRSIIDMRLPDDDGMEQYSRLITERYGFASEVLIGETLLGRAIKAFKIGGGERQVCYIAGLRGGDCVCGSILLRFLNELCECAEDDRRVFGVSVGAMLKSRTLYIVPALNADGINLRLGGIAKGGALRERIEKICADSGSEPASWQANARGVDISRNFARGFAEYKASSARVTASASDYCGEAPESEPEASAITGFLRFISGDGEKTSPVCLALTFETAAHGYIGSPAASDDGETAFKASSRSAISSRSATTARLLERISGLPSSEYPARGDLTSRAAAMPGIFAYTVGVNAPNVTLNDDVRDKLFAHYASLRETLFTAPVLI